MNLRLSVLFFCLTAFVCQAQVSPFLKDIKEIKISVGKPYKLIKGQPRYYFYDGRYTIALKTTDRRKVTLQLFDTRLNIEASRNEYMDLPEHDVQPPIESNGHFYYIYSYYNKQEKKQELCSRKVNVTQGTLEPSVVLCRTSPTISLFTEEDISAFIPVHFTVNKSHDSSKVLISYRVKPKSRNDDTNFDVWGYMVLDKDLKLEWNKEVQMPYVQTKMTKWSSTVTTKGNVYQMIYSGVDKYELILIKPDGTVESHNLDLITNLKPSEFRLDETIDGNVLGTCFYTSEIVTFKGRDGRIGISSSLNVKAYLSDGIYFAKFSPDGKLLGQGKSEIPFNLLNAYEDEETRSFNDKMETAGIAGARDVKIVDHLFYQDGSSIIVGEQQYYNYNGETVNNYAIPTLTYANLYIIKMDAQYRLVWMKKVPKIQSTTYKKDAMGIKIMNSNQALYMFFIDNKDNFELKENEVVKDGNLLTVFKMNAGTGYYEKYSLLGEDDIPGTTRMLIRMKRITGKGNKCFMEVEAGQDLETTVTFEMKE